MKFSGLILLCLFFLIEENRSVPLPEVAETSDKSDSDNNAISVKAESDVTNSGNSASKAFSYQYSIVHPQFTPTYYHVSPQILPLGYFNTQPLYFRPYQPLVLLNPQHQWVIQHPQTVQPVPDASKQPNPVADSPVETPAIEITPPKDSENEVPLITEKKEKSLDDDDTVSVSREFDEEGLISDEKKSDDESPLAKSDTEDEKGLLDAVESEGQDIVPTYDEE